MNRLFRHPLISLGVALLVATTGLIVLRLGTDADPAQRKAPLPLVGTLSPIKEDLDIYLSYTADITPYQVVNVFSRVDGYIAKLHVDKGDFVQRHQLLIEIDHTDYRHAVNQAQANLAAAVAKVAQQRAVLRSATLTLNRMNALFQDQFVSQQDLDNAQVNADAAAAALESLEAQVKQLEVALAQAETNLAYSYIRAPFSGYIAERNLDVGAYVTGTTASTSTLSRGILSLHDIDTVRVLIDVVEKDVPLIKVGQRAELRTDAYPDAVFEGRVTRIPQTLNRATRTMPVEIDVMNADRQLKGGMFARVKIHVGTHRQAVQIPLDAVSRMEDEQYVFIVRDGLARRTAIEVGARDGNWVEITKGLTGDEEVVVSGKDLVRDGILVRTHPLHLVKGER
ncbi:MAG: efflux RND transporter periplasmic adaptor subunit [Nitrospira sp.]|nr:efflux RND transporter periplasmic adaptor subunit [Nitrospira sp.]